MSRATPFRRRASRMFGLLLAASFAAACDGDGETKDVEVASTDADEFWGEVACEDLTTEASCLARDCLFRPVLGVVEVVDGSCIAAASADGYGICIETGGFGGPASPFVARHVRSGRVASNPDIGFHPRWTFEGVLFGICGREDAPVTQGQIENPAQCFCPLIADQLIEVPWENKEALQP